MRVLFLLRGPMGAGKSHWIEREGLSQYTLSPDAIRMMYQNPVYDLHGEPRISQANDKHVWGHLFQLLELRMERGDLTIIDATHVRSSAISPYKKLCQRYRYRCYIIDFTDVPQETALARNQARDSYKHVPEEAILNAYERLKGQQPQGWTTVIKPEQFWDVVGELSQPLDFSEWKKIHHIGDIHGCYDALQEYLGDGFNEDELYLFVGDLLDRGLQNGEVLQFFLQHYQKKNVILLEGNHEIHFFKWANEEEVRSHLFRDHTAPQLEQAGLDKKEVRQLYRKFRQLAYYTYHGKTVLVTHGGLSAIPRYLSFVSTQQLIKGFGEYEEDIDHEWAERAAGHHYQIHGHRNIYRLPVEAAERSYNLEGQVEHGGHLRIVTLSPEGFETHEIRNSHYHQPALVPQKVKEEQLSVKTLLEYMRNHPYIREKKLGDNLSSFNFTTQAFHKGKWDDINVRARGLFINTHTEEIVSRSYNKFFNIEERPETKLGYLADHLCFPIDLYEKPNGYLGILGYDQASEQLVFSSKSMIDNTFSHWFRELFYQAFTEEQAKVITQSLRDENTSWVFEVILPQKDPHIIRYDRDQLVLLDVIDRDITFSKKPYEELVAISQSFGVTVKKHYHTFDSWLDFYRWYREVTSHMGIEEEGYVVEGAAGAMVKIKLPYYQFWKQMRGLKETIAKGHTIVTQRLYSPLHNQVYNWMNAQEREYLRQTSIIQLREDFQSAVATPR
ncbi:RNA ligase [Desmospora activa]|uniref:AAA domain-containing protein n=1 Tax=Desmospora activa DSM 45169 TaxID=1121389 RepID=A0A2T4Z7Z3_9BACL|nr:RNA ligase [Desmospora activa]PTM57975.1 AAA domain-containing protein [Desmospora activa DSM 45169]